MGTEVILGIVTIIVALAALAVSWYGTSKQASRDYIDILESRVESLEKEQIASAQDRRDCIQERDRLERENIQLLRQLVSHAYPNLLDSDSTK